MTIEASFLLIIVGVIGGAWNAVAGGATLFTFPALMAVGLPPLVANATNYVAMLPSNAAALPAYSQELKKVGTQIWPLIIVSGLGAITGSMLLLASTAKLFETLIPFLILASTVLFACGSSLGTGLRKLFSNRSSTLIIYSTLFLFSIYGGYFGAGLGIILLAVVQILGYTAFHVANSLKNLMATSFTLISVIIFGVGGIIAWPEAMTMIIGSTAGGYLGGRYARLLNEVYLRSFIVVFGFMLSGVYFYKVFVSN